MNARMESATLSFQPPDALAAAHYSAAKKRRVIAVLLFPTIIAALLAVVSAGLWLSSAVRAYVGGESFWSKGQKVAVQSLYQYAITRDERDYHHYKVALTVPLADRRGRLELEKPSPNLDTAAYWFIRGKNHPADARPMAQLVLWFGHYSYVRRAVEIWTAGDREIDALMRDAAALHGASLAATPPILARIAADDQRLTQLEDDFSTTLGAGARVMSAGVLGMALFAGFVLIWIGAVVVSRLWRQEHAALAATLALRESEANLRQAQKMEAVGRLAGGIAHDFNNLLTVIDATLDLADRRPADANDPERDAEIPSDFIANARRASERAAMLTRQLLAFSRQQVTQPRVIDLAATVVDMREMLSPLIGEDVRVETLCEPGTPAIQADAGQISQVILNLVVNARDAMPHGGTLTIRTRQTRRLATGDAIPAGSSQLGQSWAVLEVTDSGVGMDCETQARAFEPFFTTKQDGGGTGLGLSVVYGIVSQWGGQVEVESAPGVGSTFRLVFPASEAAGGKMSGKRRVEPARGNETVLLVEDEESVRSLALHLLSRQGYVVISAANGIEALRYVDELRDGESIHIVVSDVVMPGMGGIELAQQLASRGRHIPMVFMSGYTNEAVPLAEMFGREAPFLAKPFTVHQLGEIVRQTLDSQS